jgi:hypothetical protein
MVAEQDVRKDVVMGSTRRRIVEADQPQLVSNMQRTSSAGNLGFWTQVGEGFSPAAPSAAAAATVPIPYDAADPLSDTSPRSPWQGGTGGGGGGGSPPGAGGGGGGGAPPPGPPAPGVQIPQEGFQLGHMMTSQVDPTLLEQPIAFTGLAKDWRAWRVRFSAWLTGIDEKYDLCLKHAEARGQDPMWTHRSCTWTDSCSYI